MITPRLLINQKAYTPTLLLTREMLVSVGPCVKKPGGCTNSDNLSRVSHVSVKQRMLNLWCLFGRQPLLEFHLPCCQETGHWRVVYSGAVGDVPVYRAWAEDRSVCPFCGAVVLGRLLGSDPLSWVVVKTEDPLRESGVPGRNVGKLTLRFIQ